MLCEGYIDFERQTPKEVKGFPTPLPSYRVVGVGSSSSWQVRSVRSSSRFVGRESDMATLEQAANDTVTTGGRVVFLVGDPEVGKLRLTHEFAERLHEKEWRVITTDCSPILHSSPYGSLKDLLRSNSSLKWPRPLRACRRSARWPAAALAIGSGFERSACLWRTRNGTNWSRGSAAVPLPTPRALFSKTPSAAIARCSSSRISIGSTIRAAWPSRRLLSLNARQSLLTVFTSRPHSVPEWLARRNASRLWLRPLHTAAGASLVDELLEQFAPASADLRERILRHTGNVPLFIEEVCRQLAEPKSLGKVPVGSHPNGSLVELGVSPTVQGVIATRIDRLT